MAEPQAQPLLAFVELSGSAGLITVAGAPYVPDGANYPFPLPTDCEIYASVAKGPSIPFVSEFG